MKHLSFLSMGLLSALVACGGSTADTTDSGIGGGGDATTDGTTVSDTSTGTDGTTPMDGSMPPPDGGGMGMIACGMSMCNAATQVCCVTGMGMGATEACVATGSCMGVSLPCTGPSNCPTGDVCCGSFTMGDGGFGITVSCEATCTMGRELCQTNADCPMGDQCRRGPGGFRTCRPAFDGGPPMDAGVMDTGTGG